MKIRLILIFVQILIYTLYAQKLPLISAQEAGFDPQRLSGVDSVIISAIDSGEIPGAVLLVLKDFKIAYKKAYGNRQLIPQKREMNVETIFDMASLTKPVASATSLMILLEEGNLRLLDKVSDYFPGYIPWVDPDSGNKSDIRIIHLLTHTSGLPAYAHPDMLQKRYNSTSKDTLYRHIEKVERLSKPGSVFKYSGLNFITIQRLVEKISSISLDKFTKDHIFTPLEMTNTAYSLNAQQLKNCAATEVLAGKPLIGTVHDPMARIVMKGNSGNAGLFSSADDMAIYAAMLLNNGSWNGSQILSPLGVKAFTSVPQGFDEFGRALGWDLNSAYASNQGDLLSPQTFGHTGYTGTSMVIDPEYNMAIIFLTNRVHPDDTGSVVRLRSLVANRVASALIEP